jgi:hypothetical protein
MVSPSGTAIAKARKRFMNVPSIVGFTRVA